MQCMLQVSLHALLTNVQGSGVIEGADDSSSSASSSWKKRLVSVATVDKCILNHDKTLNTATWLTYEKATMWHDLYVLCVNI